MRYIGSHLRSCFLTAVGLIAAVVVGYGCAHTDLGELPPIIKTTPPDFGMHGTREFNAAVSSVGIHDVIIDFGEPVKDNTFDVSVKYADGTEIPVEVMWTDAYYKLHVKGAMPFCSELSVVILAGAETIAGGILGRDLDLPFYTGSNPNDVDGADSCTADVVVSALFNETDGAIFTGDTLIEKPASYDLLKQDIDTAEIFYVDYSGLYDYAGPMIRIPVPAKTAVLQGGRAGTAMLLLKEQRTPTLIAKRYAIDFWGSYDPVYDDPTTSMFYDMTSFLNRDLYGPVYAGDLNGDGNADVILSEERPLNGKSVMQNLYILKGPVAAGDGLFLKEEADPAGVPIGDINETISEPFFLGDVDGDGKDDFGVIHNQVDRNNVFRNWDILIYHGNEDTTSIFNRTLSDIDVIEGDFSRKIIGLTSCDCNGDGISDVVVSDIETRDTPTGLREIKPNIGIFFGGRGFYGASMDYPSVKVFVNNYDHTNSIVSNLGDVDGDGFDDLGILMEEEDLYSHRIKSSKIYILMGREYWFERYFLNSKLVPSANLIIDAKDPKGLRRVDDLQMAGDIDNDGFYDIMITTDDGAEKRMSVFLGSDGYRNMGWELSLDDADVIWTFKKP